MNSNVLGHPLLNSFGWGKVTTDWMAFIMFLAIPMITFIITLYGQREDFWEVSLLTWFSSILIFWGFFCACVLWHEVKECLFLIGHVDDMLGEDAGYFEKVKRSILCTMGSRLSGTRTTRYKIDHVENNTDQDGSEKNEDAEGTSFFPKYLPFLYNKGDTSEEGAVSSFCPEGPFSLISKWKWLSCMYTKVNPSDPCNRVYTIDEARGNATFITRSSWSLEKLFFRRGGLLSAIPITFGTSGITPHQINSNIACKLIGTLIIILLFGGIIVWYELVGGALGIVLVFLLIVVLFADISTYRLWEIKKDVDEGKETIRYWKVHKVTKPSDQLVVSRRLFFEFITEHVFCAPNTLSNCII